MRKDIASRLLASTIISTQIITLPQGKILQSIAQASLPPKPLQTLASFSVSRKTNFAFAAIRPTSIRTLSSIYLKPFLEGLHAVYSQPSRVHTAEIYYNRQPSKRFEVFQISLFQLIFTDVWLLKNLQS